MYIYYLLIGLTYTSNYKSHAAYQIRMYWTLQSPTGLAVLACTIHKCIYNNVYINHSLKKNIIHPSPHRYISGLHKSIVINKELLIC